MASLNRKVHFFTFSLFHLSLEVHVIEGVTEVLRLVILCGIVEILTAERSSQLIA